MKAWITLWESNPNYSDNEVRQAWARLFGTSQPTTPDYTLLTAGGEYVVVYNGLTRRVITFITGAVIQERR